MPNGSETKRLRERIAYSAEERLGRALSELLDNPLLTGAIGRAFDARERAAQAQEFAMGALNIPSAADVERLTRRLRSISQRLERIEDAIHELARPPAASALEQRLEGIERRLETLGELVGGLREGSGPRRATGAKPKGERSTAKPKQVAQKRSRAVARPAPER